MEISISNCRSPSWALKVSTLWSLSQKIESLVTLPCMTVYECQCQCQSKINVARIAELLRSPRRRRRSGVTKLDLYQEETDEKKNVRRWRKTGRDGDDRMSDGNEFQRRGYSDWKCASTDGCEPEWWDKQLMWWWRAKSCSTRNAMTATLKSTRCGRDSQ